MSDRWEVQGFHFQVFLFYILNVSDVTTDSDYLISFVYNLCFNLYVSLGVLGFENEVSLFIVYVVNTTQVDQVGPQIYYLYLLCFTGKRRWLIIAGINMLFLFFFGVFLRWFSLIFILKYEFLYFKF